MKGAATVKKNILVLALLISAFFITGCRDQGHNRFFSPSGSVLVINATELPDGARECLQADVFSANDVDGNVLTHFESCEAETTIRAAAGQYSVRVRGTTTQKVLFFNFISVGSNQLTTLTIVSKPVQFPLEVEVFSEGSGLVQSLPFGISCGTQCSHRYPSGTEVELHARIRDNQTVFAGWSGACSGKENPCKVIVSELKNVRATFHDKSLLAKNNVFPLNIYRSGNGTGRITSDQLTADCLGLCKFFFQPAPEVTLEAVADPGSIFVGWTGGCGGIGPCTVTLSEAVVVEAKFVRLFDSNETILANKDYLNISWDIFDRGIENNDSAPKFALPESFQVTQGCSGDQWITLLLRTALFDGTTKDTVCVYRDEDPLREDIYHFSFCASAPKYETECSTFLDSEPCNKARNGLKIGDQLTPIEIRLFVNDGDSQCGITEVQLLNQNENEDDDGENGNGHNGNHGNNGNEGDHGHDGHHGEGKGHDGKHEQDDT